MRVYVPATLARLAEYAEAGSVPPGPDRVVAPDASEDGEYAALMTAADLSAELLAGPGRRVVLVAELPDGSDPDAELPKRLWAAVHADVADRPAGADPDEDLGWFAVQEIGELLG